MLRFIALLFAIGIVVGLIMGGSYVFDAYMLSPEDDAQTVTITVGEGASVEEIALSLEQQGLITSPLFFKVYVRLNDAVLQAGSFELSKGMNLARIVSDLSYAEAVEQVVTLPEGLTVAQMGEIIADAFDEISERDWERLVSKNGFGELTVTELLKGIPEDQGLEGYLFPDTYRFAKDAQAKAVAETMVLTLSRRMAEAGIVIPESLELENTLTLHETLTLASIIEREVRDPEDMAVVAGIFYSRMQIGMALQADSTVNYVTGKNDPGVSLEDSKVNSPYNTYRNLGLPPGPISNPGMNAINAAMNPQDSDYLYFLTDEEGTAYFAITFDQHIDNKYRYLK